MQTHHPESRRPAFRWLGWRGKHSKRSPSILDLNEPKKRVFGTEITNFSLKKNKVDSLADRKSNQKLNVPKHLRHFNVENSHGENILEPQSKQRSKGFVYGPFTPVSISGVTNSTNKNAKRVEDFETLASTFCPRYHNQGTFRFC